MPTLKETEIALDLLAYNPHQLLGIHSLGSGKKIRLWRPGAPFAYVELFGNIIEMRKVHPHGLFEVDAPENTTGADYRVYAHHGLLFHDPYSFPPTFGELDAHLFGRGVHYRLYEVLGARPCQHQGVQGVKFALWAPSAAAVSLVGDFNLWDGRVNPMRSMGSTGVWELFIPGLAEGEKYKFEIRTQEGHLRLKNDPYSTFNEVRPKTASIVFDVNRHVWNDQEWVKRRSERNRESFPLNIYEVHLGSWRKKGEHFFTYRELAPMLASYCKEMGFSHIELMGLCEHPLDESWGYQVTGFFAATSRFGNPEDFQYFVDHLHSQGVGVLLDWVPAHFPIDDYSLAQFDGSYLYEHADPKKGFHPHWNTYIFNYGRKEVSNFLIASALFWLDKMHVDGLRVDAVASMLYLDYGRHEGEWIPNLYGGNENLEAIEFLKHLNSIVHDQFPHALMMAEESTSFLGVTHSLEKGGLGFDFKWNMGWMNDTLRYFQKDLIYRHYHQNDLTFGLLYAFSEKFLLPLSHDEVVHEKAALLSKMPGDDWQKFANMRLLYSYQITQPGKKLIFMGAELGAWAEWNCKEEIPWDYLLYERHGQLHRFFKEINHFYHERRALWEFDHDPRGFEWIDCSDCSNSTLSYLRKGTHAYLLCVHHFTANFIPHYFIHLQNAAVVREVFNSDSVEFGGSGKINPAVEIAHASNGKPIGIEIQLAPLATMIFEVQFVL
jgi:1,4-alpha-glucan branching enzyme